jgi:uncharacterized protein YecT (DUF1311 family)
MILRRAALLLIGLVALSCATTAAEQEKAPLTLKQAKAEFEKADRELNDAWAAVKKAMSAEEFAPLKDEQKAWLEYREHMAHSPARTGEPAEPGQRGKQFSPEYYEEATALTQDRAAWLRGVVAEWKDEDSVSGVWSDSYGGEMQVAVEKKKLYFSIDVVRGPTAHVGEIAGVASWNEPLGWFTDKGRDKDKPDETNLAFISENRRLRVVGANTSYYHGARAYFDGTYVRTRLLTAKEKAALIEAAKKGDVPEAK